MPYLETEVAFLINQLNNSLLEAKKVSVYHSQISDENIFLNYYSD